MKKKIIVGNWKMNPETLEEAKKIFQRVNTKMKASKNVDAVICPPFPFINALALKKSKKILLGAENLFNEEKGSFTGEVSASMLVSVGAKYVIVGHSERRKMGETDEMVNKKAVAALKAKLIPIICIGESVRDEEGNYLAFIKNQLEKALVTVSRNELKNIIIAYEPLYAIGATEALSGHDVHQMTLYIKKVLLDIYRVRNIKEVPVTILYGGSVDEKNAYALLKEGEADGFLIGRQSLEAESFLSILETARLIK